MRAIVLAAGMSGRMGGDINKCIMPLNDKGDTMLGRVLGQLRALSVWPTVVVGYQAEEIMRRYYNEASFVYNPEYRTTGSLYSAWLAWTVMEPSTVVMMVSGSNIITDAALSRLYYTMTFSPGVAVMYPYPHHLEEVRNVYHYLEVGCKFGEDYKCITECFPHSHLPVHPDYAAYSQFMMVFGTTLNSIPTMPNWRTVNSGWLIKGCGAIEVDAGDTLDVNTPHDFELAKEMIKSWSS